eukprot:CAMPEP_0172938158 /NCGR_PEP_ID=MMETSP1075-20121228/222885_1 /TAXON_ID=2916 /ORGANISM="Ceratium fusus, Strain PA161109" /LENGTH=58 /DNA_ID=CAMNT_0013799537 /DNA_START=60 /DNA_END=236 /DNA_ORIENTATION=-
MPLLPRPPMQWTASRWPDCLRQRRHAERNSLSVALSGTPPSGKGIDGMWKPMSWNMVT